MTPHILDVERHPTLDIRVELRKNVKTEGVSPEFEELDVTPYTVRLADGEDYADEPFYDEFEARSHFRTVCQRALGITPAYKAPVFASPVADTPRERAFQVYTFYHSRLGQAGCGSEQAKAILREMIDDQEVIDHEPYIFELCEGAHDWINASIRTACRRRRAIESAVATAEIESLPGFGAF